MSNTNLIPEQRPDKNGNVVTRWVRGMFKAKEETREIPRVTIDVAPKNQVAAPTQEDQEMYDRLVGAMPPREDMNDKQEHDYDVLNNVFKDGEYFVLPALEKLGRVTSYTRVREAATALRIQGVDEELTEAQLRAYESMRATIRAAILESQEKTGSPLPDTYHATIDLPRYVLLNTEDGPLLEEIVKRGVSSKEQVFETLNALKEDKIARPIRDGFL